MTPTDDNLPRIPPSPTAGRWSYCWLLSGLVVLVLFMDVLLLQASLQPSNIAGHMGAPANMNYKTLRTPDIETRSPHQGFSDLGSTAWQSEPARRSQARAFQASDFPLWNPVTAGGTPTYNGLSDIRFSLFTTLGALFFDGNAHSFDLGLLLLFWVGTACLLRLLLYHFGLAPVAATGAAVFFLLNGFSSANLGSQNGHVYYFGPILILALVSLVTRPSSGRWATAIAVQAMVLSITMLPATLMTMIAAYAIVFGVLLDRYGWKIPSTTLATVVATPFLGLLTLAFLWFPLLDSLLSGELFDVYQDRDPAFYTLDNLLTIFTPHHFWEHYNGFRPQALLSEAGVESGRLVMPHLGIVAAVVSAGVLSFRWQPWRWTVGIATALTVASYLWFYHLPPLHYLDGVRLMSLIGMQYFSILPALCATLMLAFALHRFASGERPWLGPLLMLILAGYAFWRLFDKLGWPDTQPYLMHVQSGLWMLLLAAVLVALPHLWKHRPVWVCALLVLALSLELVSYLNPLRPMRYDLAQQPPDHVRFLLDTPDRGRVLSINTRHTLHPNFGELYGIPQAGTQLSNMQTDYRRLYYRAFGMDTNLFLILTRTEQGYAPRQDPPLNHIALDALGITHVLVNKHGRPYRQWLRQQGYPVVYETPTMRIFQNDDATPLMGVAYNLAEGSLPFHRPHPEPAPRLYSNDPELLKAARATGIPVNTAPTVYEAVTPTTQTADSLTVSVNLKQPGVLWYLDNMHPDWHARVDDRPASLGRVNDSFKGLVLPAGRHTVTLRFLPRSFRWGLAVSTLMGLMLLGFWGQAIRRGYRERRQVE